MKGCNNERLSIMKRRSERKESIESRVSLVLGDWLSGQTPFDPCGSFTGTDKLWKFAYGTQAVAAPAWALSSFNRMPLFILWGLST